MRKSSGLLMAGATVIALVIFALIGASVVGIRSHAQHRPFGEPPPSQPVADTDTHRSLVAQREADRLLGLAPVPPGSRVVSGPPAAQLRNAPLSISGVLLTTQTRWWTGPGTVSQTLSYLRTHVPDGLTLTTWVQGIAGRAIGLVGPPLPAPLPVPGSGLSSPPDYVGYQAAATLWYLAPQLFVSVAASGTGVGIRADAQIARIPVRTSQSKFTGVASIVVSLSGGSTGSAIHRVLMGTKAAELVAVVNRLDIDASGIHPCPMMPSLGSDSLSFRDARGRPLGTATTGGCDRVFIEIPSAGNASPAQFLLSGAGELDRSLRAALGVTSHCPTVLQCFNVCSNPCIQQGIDMPRDVIPCHLPMACSGGASG